MHFLRAVETATVISPYPFLKVQQWAELEIIARNVVMKLDIDVVVARIRGLREVQAECKSNLLRRSNLLVKRRIGWLGSWPVV